MGEPCGDLDLAEKTLRSDDRGEVWTQHLEGHAPTVFYVMREKHGRHAAFTERTLDGVAAGKGGLEAAQYFRHRFKDDGGGTIPRASFPTTLTISISKIYFAPRSIV